jgi:histone acetyltransferase 1
LISCFYFKLGDIIASLNKWLTSSTTTNLDLFVTKIKSENDFLLFGEQILTYELKGEDSSPYFIYRINPKNLCNNAKFFDWYARLKTFLVFFIDIVSSIVQNDTDWISYIIYEQYQNDNGDTCYAPIGFTTIYLCYGFPNKKRPRIRLESCFLILFLFKDFIFLVKC